MDEILEIWQDLSMKITNELIIEASKDFLSFFWFTIFLFKINWFNHLRKRDYLYKMAGKEGLAILNAFILRLLLLI